MENLTEGQKGLYRTSIQSLNNMYSDYLQFDLQIIDTLDFENISTDDLYYLFNLSKYGTELCKKLEFEIMLRKLNKEN